MKKMGNSPNCSNILSHSSRMKCFKCFKLNFLLRIKAKTRPGVPTTIWGVVDLSVSSSFCIGMPPKKTPTFTPDMYFEKRSYSLLIWKANSRVWHITNTYTWFSVGSNCCKVANTKTAVFPIPDFAWHKISIPRTACGMHSCWTEKREDGFEVRKLFLYRLWIYKFDLRTGVS